jgi:hypothetical protein
LNPKKPNFDEEYARHLEYAERYSKNNKDTPNGMNREEDSKGRMTDKRK